MRSQPIDKYNLEVHYINLIDSHFKVEVYCMEYELGLGNTVRIALCIIHYVCIVKESTFTIIQLQQLS